MKTTRFVWVATVAAAATLFTRNASAAGTALDVQSARGTGMAAATTAFIDDSSAVFYNPAGIAQGKVFDAQAGINLIVPSFNFTSKTTGEKTSVPFNVVTPFQVYASGGVTDWLSLGVGVFTPFGLKLSWPDGWQGRRLITTAELRTFYVNPTAAVKFGPVRFGAGFQLVRATVNLQRNIGFGDQEGSVDLGAATWGVGGNAGLQIEAVKQYLSFGAHYRSPVKLSFDGRAHFSNVPQALQETIHDQDVSTSVIQPGSLAMGVATHPIKDLVIDFDAVWIHWDQFKSINLQFPNDASGSLSNVQRKDWNNTVNFHLGAEGTLSEHFLLRGGVLVDPTPSPANTLTPDIPDGTRVNLALGGTWRHGSGIHVDLGYQFIIITSNTSTAPQLPGDYGGLVNILGLSVGYSTPPKKEASNWVDPAAGVESTPPPASPSPPPESAPPSSTPPPSSGL